MQFYNKKGKIRAVPRKISPEALVQENLKLKKKKKNIHNNNNFFSTKCSGFYFIIITKEKKTSTGQIYKIKPHL